MLSMFYISQVCISVLMVFFFQYILFCFPFVNLVYTILFYSYVFNIVLLHSTILLLVLLCITLKYSILLYSTSFYCSTHILLFYSIQLQSTLFCYFTLLYSILLSCITLFYMFTLHCTLFFCSSLILHSSLFNSDILNSAKSLF